MPIQDAATITREDVEGWERRYNELTDLLRAAQAERAEIKRKLAAVETLSAVGEAETPKGTIP